MIPVGYMALIARFDINAPEPRLTSYIGKKRRTSEFQDGRRKETYREEMAPKDDSDVGHLVFAIRYEGVDLLVLSKIFERLDATELCAAIREKPTSGYLRRLWFFYEFLGFDRLELEDSASCNYADALPVDDYYTHPKPELLKRYRVRNSMLGNGGWCPIVRKTKCLSGYESKKLNHLAANAVSETDPAMLARAIRYLHNKETRASFEIEHATPTRDAEKFVETLLKEASAHSAPVYWDENKYVELHNELAEPEFPVNGFRKGDVRISEFLRLDKDENVHWVGTSHVNLLEVMDAFTLTWSAHHTRAKAVEKQTTASCGDPFVDLLFAGCLSFGFVYIHPMDDCNGRIHRLMLQHILASVNFTTKAYPIPISAAILNDMGGYDAALEEHSRRALPFIGYSIDKDEPLWPITVEPESSIYFRYIDMTAQLEALCKWFELAVTKELPEELQTLAFFDRAQGAMRQVIRMPDRLEVLFVATAFHNSKEGRGFTVGRSKREKIFHMLKPNQFDELRDALQEAWDEVDVRVAKPESD